MVFAERLLTGVQGLTELSRATRDQTYIATAKQIADAAIANLTDANGILHDPCEPDCGGMWIVNTAERQILTNPSLRCPQPMVPNSKVSLQGTCRSCSKLVPKTGMPRFCKTTRTVSG